MKIKTITCHSVYNHGASLQAYALQTYLVSLGHDVEIIDYKPDYLSGHFNLWSIPHRYNKLIVRELYFLIKLPFRLWALRRKKEFDKFTRRYLRLTKRYNSFEQLAKDSLDADVYIAGSDQIWNTRFKNGLDKSFYLGFAPCCARKVSYAASFAYKTIQKEYVNFITKQLNNFDILSVREASGVQLLKSLGYSGSHVCDPVFLLNREQWNSIALEDFSNERYILIYDFENNIDIKIIANRMAKKMQCKIYSVGPCNLPYADKCFIYRGPDIFVALIRDAICIISNSFHGSAFSLLYHRDFFVVKRNDGLNDRMLDFLDHYAISQRMIDVNVSIEDLFATINYELVESILQKDISFSKYFLVSNLTL